MSTGKPEINVLPEVLVCQRFAQCSSVALDKSKNNVFCILSIFEVQLSTMKAMVTEVPPCPRLKNRMQS